jgi:hypothetical protein
MAEHSTPTGDVCALSDAEAESLPDDVLAVDHPDRSLTETSLNTDMCVSIAVLGL